LDPIRQFWEEREQLVGELRASSELTNRTSVVTEVERIFRLLDQMGTCTPPPQLEDAMHWRMVSSIFYAFVVTTRIGYGDMNVRTINGESTAPSGHS
jgi:hypothetical protein